MGLYDINGNSLTVSGGGVDNSLLYNFTKWQGKTLVTDGNSLTAHNKWGDHLTEFLGMEHYNCALSGSSLTRNELTKGFTMEDIRANIADAYPDHADLVILQGDTNVGMDGSPSDQMDGDTPKTTWTARMNYMIRCIRAKFHNVVIVLMPDSYRYEQTAEWNQEAVEAMRALAEYNRIAFFNFDQGTPWNPNYADNHYNWAGDPKDPHAFEINGMDYVHPSVHSYTKSKGYALAQFVAGLVFDPEAPNGAAQGWNEQYTVTYALAEGVQTSNTQTNFWANEIYQTAISGAFSVLITMGGEDITDSAYQANQGWVRIPAITGDVVITAE